MFFLPVELIVNRIHYLIIILICQTLSGIWYSIKPKRDSCYKVAFCLIIILICQTLSGIWYSIKPKRDSCYKVAFCDLI